MLPGRRIYILPGIGQDRMTYPVSRIQIRQIGLIRPPPDAPFLKIGFNFLTSGAQQRPDDYIPDRRNPRKPPQACPPEQIEQHRFADILPLMGHRDPLGRNFPADLFKALIPVITSGLLL